MLSLSLFDPFKVFFAAEKERAEDERKAIAFELEQAKQTIEADELARIDYDFKLDAQKDEITKLKTRLETQGKQFEQNIQEVCDARIKLEEIIKSRDARIKTLEEELTEINSQAETWFASAKKINDLLRSKFIHVLCSSRICLPFLLCALSNPDFRRSL